MPAPKDTCTWISEGLAHLRAGNDFPPKYPRRKHRYSKAMANKVCARVVTGQHPWSICASTDMPTFWQLVVWRREHEDFDKQFQEARRVGVSKEQASTFEARMLVGDYICECYGASERSLQEILDEDPLFPSVSRWLQWAREIPHIGDAWEAAKEARALYLAERIIAIADESKSDTAQSDALRIKTRQWLAERYGSRVYNPAKQVELTQRTDVSNMTDEELRARLWENLKQIQDKTGESIVRH